MLLFTYSPADSADPQGPGQPWKIWVRWLCCCLDSHQLSGRTMQRRAEPLLYDAVPCQEIWGLRLCGRKHPFSTRKTVFLRSLFPPSWSSCLVVLPQEALWGELPVEINQPAQWAELLFPSAQWEKCILSLCFSPRLCHNKREGGNVKGTSSQCHLAPAVLEHKGSRRHSRSQIC